MGLALKEGEQGRRFATSTVLLTAHLIMEKKYASTTGYYNHQSSPAVHQYPPQHAPHPSYPYSAPTLPPDAPPSYSEVAPSRQDYVPPAGPPPRSGPVYLLPPSPEDYPRAPSAPPTTTPTTREEPPIPLTDTDSAARLLLNPAPPSFSRPRDPRTPCGPFEPITVPCLSGAGGQLAAGFPTDPHPPRGHDVARDDWARFLDDVRRAGAFAGEMRVRRAFGDPAAAHTGDGTDGVMGPVAAPGRGGLVSSEPRCPLETEADRGVW